MERSGDRDPSGAEIARLKEQARALFLDIARRHKLRPSWSEDESGGLECAFYPDQPFPGDLRNFEPEPPLVLCFDRGGLSWREGEAGEDGFSLDARGQKKFVRSLERWL